MDKLNDKQLQAVNDDSEVVLVIAGAGSGKTTVLTQKINKLVSQNKVSTNEILAITFTNKATKEMKERLISSLNDEAKGLGIYTFHALSVLIIRENLKYLAYHDHNFNIIDEEDKKKILQNIIKQNNLDYKVNDVRFTISHAKSFCKNKDDVLNLIYDNNIKFIYEEYQKYLQQNNAFDFDDLLLYAYELLKIDDVNMKYKNRYKYIHVDEYQDTSIIQSEMLKLMKGNDTKLFIVGDVDQSIYEWRGATIENIMGLQKTYKNTKIIKLEQNYRSTKNILNCANKLIENNENRYDKELWTDKPNGQKVNGYRFKNETEQAEFIKREVKYLEDFGTNLDEIAILYRFNYQSKKIEEMLIRANISYKIYGGLKFYDRLEVKDTIAYLRLITNNNDNISFLRVCNVPKRKVGESALNLIRSHSEQNNISYLESALEVGGPSLKSFCNTIVEYKELIEQDFMSNFQKFLNIVGYEQHLLKNDDQETVNERLLNIEQILYSVKEALENGLNLNDYLNELILFTDTDDEYDHDAVVLSTVHGVKGLEFDNVFLVGVNENIFPKNPMNITDRELEEERRIMYVAVTRARKKLTITNYSFNYTGMYLENSRFTDEMEIDIIEQYSEDSSNFSIF